MSIDPQLASLYAFVAVTSLILLAGGVLWRSHERLRLRLRSLESEWNWGPRGGTRSAMWERMRQRISRGHAAPDLASAASRSLQQQLVMAGIYSPAASGMYVLLRALLAASVILAGVLLHLGYGQSHPLILPASFLLTAAGFLAPNVLLSRRIAARQRALKRSLPDFLDLTVTCIEGGLSLAAATERVTDELQTAHPILAAEMQRLQREIHLGGAPDTALKRLAERSGVESIAGLALAVQQSIQMGAGIVDALRNHADTLRQEREHAAEERAQQASIKILAPTMLFIFPVTFVVLAGPAVIEMQAAFKSSRSRSASIASQ